MGFLFRRPFIWILVGIFTVVGIVVFSGVLNPRPTDLYISRIEPDKITITGDGNATFSITIENMGQESHTMSLQLVYTDSLAQLTFYNETGDILGNIVQGSKNYTLIHPYQDTLGRGAKRTLTIRIKGFQPAVSSLTELINLQILSDGKLTDVKSLQLTIRRG